MGVAATSAPLIDDVALKVSDLVEEIMRRVDARRSSDIYRDGLLNILNHTEFKEREGIQQIIRVLEEHQMVERLVRRSA